MPKPSDLILYHYDTCPFCRRVFFALRNLGIEIEDKDIYRDQGAMAELVAARGRQTVPVLRIQEADGTVRWMPESAEIIRYLQDELA